MAYQRSYTVTPPSSQPIGQIDYGETHLKGWLTTLRIAAIIGEIGLTFALPGVGGAIAAGLAGASAQTALDYVAGEGNAVTTVINFAASVLPAAAGEFVVSKGVINLGSKEAPYVHTLEFFKNLEGQGLKVNRIPNSVSEIVTGEKGEFGAALNQWFKPVKVQKAYLTGQRRALKAGLLAELGDKGVMVKSLEDLANYAEAQLRILEASAEANFTWFPYHGVLAYMILEQSNTVPGSEIWRLIEERANEMYKQFPGKWERRALEATFQDMKDEFVPVLHYTRAEISATLKGELHGFVQPAQTIKMYEELKEGMKVMFRNIKAIDTIGSTAVQSTSTRQKNLISARAIRAQQAQVEAEATKASLKGASWTAEEIAGEIGAEIKRTKAGVAKWESVERTMKYARKKARIKASQGGSSVLERELERTTRASELGLLQKEVSQAANISSRDIANAASVKRSKKVLNFFSTDKGRTITQVGQMGSGADLGREIIRTPINLLLHGELDFAGITAKSVKWQRSNPVYRMKAYMKETKFGKTVRKLYSAENEVERNVRKHLIPFVYGSDWLLAIRLIKKDPEGHLNYMIVFHKDRRYPPVFINNVPKKRALEFITAPSPGAYYHSPRGWALSANGQDIVGSMAGLPFAAAFLPNLASLRNFLSLSSNTIGVAKDGFSSYGEDLTKALGRNWHRRLARVGGIAVGGRLGGKFASLTEKQFISETGTPKVNIKGRDFLNATLTSGKTTLLSRGKGHPHRGKRRGQRYMENAIRRPMGQLQKALK